METLSSSCLSNLLELSPKQKRYYNRDIIKTRNTSYGFTETHQKDHWKIFFYYGEGENGTHTLDSGHVQMATVDPRHD